MASNDRFWRWFARLGAAFAVAVGVALGLLVSTAQASHNCANETYSPDICYAIEHTNSLLEGELSTRAVQDDRDLADLAWYGIWALVGVNLAQLFAPMWFRAWRFMRE